MAVKREEGVVGSGGNEVPGAARRAAEVAGEVRTRLLAAYDAHRRDLPWRGDPDPYRVWVSEIMLQQTRVETVIPYYKEWMARFPDLDSLARAPGEEVLQVWQGLGYYARARNLHQAARLVREELDGRIPTSVTALRALPGVGEYTAGAVASIAFGEAVPAVDGNVRRVLSRLFDLPAPGLSEQRRLAGALVDPIRPGDFNQALMELGALVCTPRDPRCGACPLSSLCLAAMRGTEAERPTRISRKPPREAEVAVLVAVTGPREGRLLLFKRRPPEGLLAGMWEFPGVEVEEGVAPGDAARVLAEELGLNPPLGGGGAVVREPAQPSPELSLESVVHRFTHLTVRYHPFLMEVTREGSTPEEGRWVPENRVEDIPLPAAQRKILARVQALRG